MLEQPYPISCRSCEKLLYGPVKFCPYCASATTTPPTVETTNVEPEHTGHATKNISAIPSPISVLQEHISSPHNETPPESLEGNIETSSSEIDSLQASPVEHNIDKIIKSPAQNDTRIAEKTTEGLVHPNNTGKLKWIALALVLSVGIASYFIFHIVVKPPPPESTRVALDDILRHGTSLSMSITKLPKLEKVLQAAQKLGEISSRYQEQSTSAKSNLNDVRNARDKSLKAYQGCVIELVRYTPEQISSAMGVIRKADLTPREKIVTELIEQHVNFLRTSNKANPEKFLLDFNQRFSNFAE